MTLCLISCARTLGRQRLSSLCCSTSPCRPPECHGTQRQDQHEALYLCFLQGSFRAAVDRSTVVTYWQRRSRDEFDDETGHLMDMQAGADISSDDEADKDEVSTARFSFDEDNKPVVSDNILQTLHREVEETLRDLRASTQRVNGRSQCRLCTFRSFSELTQLRTHVAKHHSAKNQYVCSGRKQIKIILAMRDHAASSLRKCSPSSRSCESHRQKLEIGVRHGRTQLCERGVYRTNTVSPENLLMRELILSHAQVYVPQCYLCRIDNKQVRGSECSMCILIYFPASHRYELS